MATNPQASDLSIEINTGQSLNRIRQLESALSQLTRSGSTTADNIQNLGGTASNAGSNLGNLGGTASNTGGAITALGGATNTANNHINNFGNTTVSVTNNINNMNVNATQLAQVLNGALVHALTQATNATNTNTTANNANANSTANAATGFQSMIGRLTGAKMAIAGFAGSALALAGSFAFIGKAIGDVTKLSDELTKMARVAGSSVQDVQKWTFGAKAMGIETDKLTDIFRDVQDKVGDFLSTGGGELKDFFDNVAPKVGVTAEQFRNLSGDQALLLYVDSLQKANLSQREMIFYMEGLASDSSDLYQLLKDNAKGLKLYADMAEQMGATLDDKTIRQLQELKTMTGLLENQFTGLKIQLAKEFLPVAMTLASEFLNNKRAMDALKSTLSAIGEIAKGVAIAFLSITTTVVQATKSVGAFFAWVRSGGDDEIAKQFGQDFKKAYTDLAYLTDAINGSSSKLPNGMNEGIKAMTDLRLETEKTNKEFGKTGAEIAKNTELMAKMSKAGGYQMMIVNAYKKAGLSDEWAKIMAAEVGRENDYNPDVLFGYHKDRSNGKVNVGMHSWQGDRGKKLEAYLIQQGLLVNGAIVRSQETLDAMARFGVSEIMGQKRFAKTRNAMLSDPNLNMGATKAFEITGRNFEAWDYDGTAVLGAKEAAKHKAKLYGYHRQINAKVNSGLYEGSKSMKDLQDEAQKAQQEAQKQFAEAQKIMADIGNDNAKNFADYKNKLKAIKDNTALTTAQKNQAITALNAERDNFVTNYANGLVSQIRSIYDDTKSYKVSDDGGARLAELKNLKDPAQLQAKFPEIFKQENTKWVKELEEARDMAIKREEIALKLVQKRKDLEAQKDELKPSEYVAKMSEVNNQITALENANNARVSQQQIEANNKATAIALANIEKEKQAKLLTINQYKMGVIESINAEAKLAEMKLDRNSETYDEEKQAIWDKNARDIQLYNLNRQIKLNGLRADEKVTLESINRKWDLEAERRQTEEGAKYDSELLNAERMAEAMALVKQKRDAFKDMLGGVERYGNDAGDAFGFDAFDVSGQLAKQMRERQNIIQDAYENEAITAQEHQEALLAIERNYAIQRQSSMISTTASMFGTLTGLAKSYAGEQSKTYRAMFIAEKAFNIASIVMNNASALSKAWASAPFPANLIAVAKTAASTGVLQSMVAAVQPQGFESGGYTGGYGIKQIAGLVHGQEYVLNAKATSAIGVAKLDRMNKTGKIDSGSQPNIKVTVHNNVGADIQTRMTDGELEVYVNRAVKQSWQNLSNPSSHEARSINSFTTANVKR